METSMPFAVIFCKVMISTERYVSSWAIPVGNMINYARK